MPPFIYNYLVALSCRHCRNFCDSIVEALSCRHCRHFFFCWWHPPTDNAANFVEYCVSTQLPTMPPYSKVFWRHVADNAAVYLNYWRQSPADSAAIFREYFAAPTCGQCRHYSQVLSKHLVADNPVNIHVLRGTQLPTMPPFIHRCLAIPNS